MVNLQPISTGNGNTTTSTSTDESSISPSSSSSPPLPSPTSHLPHQNLPIMPPFLPHLLYPPNNNHQHQHFYDYPPTVFHYYLPPPPVPVPVPVVPVFTSCYYYVAQPHDCYPVQVESPTLTPTIISSSVENHKDEGEGGFRYPNRNRDRFRWRKVPRKVEGDGGQNQVNGDKTHKTIWKPKDQHSGRPRSWSRSALGPRRITPPRQLSSEESTNCTTTLMIKNIPNTLSRRSLINLLDTHCRKQNTKDGLRLSQYDFLYVPFDFIRNMNLGYAFVNFATVEGASALKSCWTGKGWCDCPKICLITNARLQGFERCKRHFDNSTFLCDTDDYLPVIFSPPRDGFNGETCKVTTIGKRVGSGVTTIWKEKIESSTITSRLSR